MMNSNDPVREFLRGRGSSPRLIEGGLAGLIESWESVVNAVEEGYPLGLDDYLNDLDVRQLLEEALAVAPASERPDCAARLRRADEQMKLLVEPIHACLWGAEVAEEEGWSAQKNWWYFSRPLQGNPDLLAEIAEATSDR
jgi:hypothetical protein